MDTPFFVRFLTSTIVLSILLAGILLIKRLFKSRVSIKFQYNVSFIILVMLALPFLPIKSFAQWNIFNWLLGFAQSSSCVADISSINSISGFADKNTGWLKDFTVSVTRTAPELFNLVLMGLWVVGVIVMACLTVLSNRRMLAIGKSVQPLDDPKTEQLFKVCKESMGIHRKVVLGKSRLLNTPVTFGLFQPRIVLPDHPKAVISEKDTPYIFLHELNHYKHKDIPINFIMCLFQILYWFNPLVWYALKEMHTDREIACDISVLEMLEEEHYIDYGNAIINCADQILHQSQLTITAYMSGPQKQVKMRIQQIASFHKESKGLKIKSIILVTLLGFFILGNAPSISAMAEDNSKYDMPSDRTATYEDLSRYFDGFQGSFVLYNLKSDQYSIYNKEKSEIRISPDSTYKIFDALFGLESNMITRDQSSFEWDGTQYSYPAWNQNQNLSSAMKNSVNWYFQTLDKKIGFMNLQNYFNRVRYGNCNLSGGISDYWLESSLKISPVEQVRLLKSFYTNQFGFEQFNIDTVKSTLLLSQQNGKSLSGKTGTGTVNGKNVNGWFIGYVETNENTYFFATNIQSRNNASGSAAAKITLSILNEKNIYKSES